MQLVKSPLNYTGNKYRIMDQMRRHFPENIECMVDLFCGGATVGLNTNAKKIIFVDSNDRIINLLVFLSKQDFDAFINKCESIIEKYGLRWSLEMNLRSITRFITMKSSRFLTLFFIAIRKSNRLLKSTRRSS